jgi:polar amino acid transport system substrate-binding protein
LLALMLSQLAVPQAARAQDAPTAQGDSQSESAPEFSTLAELEGKRVGMGAGNVFDQLISKKDPKVNDFVYFSSLTDMVAALKSGKVDAFAGDEPSARLLVARNAGIVLMPETVAHNELGFCFAKNKDPDLVRRMNEVIDRLRSNGTLEELEAKWCGADDSVKTVPAIDWDTSGGTLHVAVDALYEPISYVKDNQIVGYDIELCLMCAKEISLRLKTRGTLQFFTLHSHRFTLMLQLHSLHLLLSAKAHLLLASHRIEVQT